MTKPTAPPRSVTPRSATHATFTITRDYPAPPAKVFAAWADLSIKKRWFSCHEDWVFEHQLDFRIGGRESNRGGPKGGTVHAYDARYYDIVENERIVYAYDMHLDETRISVSLATVEFKPAGVGRTTMTFTEQAVFLDGYDDNGSREHGTRIGLDKLEVELQRQMAQA